MKIRNFIVYILTALTVSLSGQVVSQPIAEDWESGDFSSLSWERPGSQFRWEITSEGAHGGRYCARSGNYYTLNTESVMQLGVYLTESGNLSYFRKVFSAEGSGGFLFWLDGELRDSLAGYVEWSEFQCPISSGYHVLKFCYTKNQTKSRGSDCVWIDDIQLPEGIIAQFNADSCETPGSPLASVSGNEVTLSWGSACHAEEVLLYDDVEGHPYGTVNSPGTLGWHYIDGDGAPTAPFSVLSFPNVGSPMAYVVLDDYLLAGNQYNTMAHSGHRFFGSPYHPNVTNDDWIISPELDFTEPFTFSFFARSFADRFPDEKFVAAYSMTDTNASSFIPLHSGPVTTIAEWNEYSFMVPAAAKYVAVHCVSNDQYVFCLDDLTIRGYRTSGHPCNVYRDGVLIASGVTDSVYVDSLVTPGEHCYSITYICGGLESAYSDTVCVHINAALAPVTTSEEWDSALYELLSECKDASNSHMANTLGQTTTKPAFLYSSTMHGWETVCYYMMLRLADYILNNAATDSVVQRLLDSVDLYICPLENPDGTYYLTNDLILKDGIHSIYHNYNDVQLNRNYPYLPGLEGSADIQPETQAIIDWVTPIHFVMSVNFHCGAEIVNYPWDAWTTAQRSHADADWFRYTGHFRG